MREKFPSSNEQASLISFICDWTSRRTDVFREGKLENRDARFRNSSSSAYIPRLNILKQASCARFFLSIIFSIVFSDYILTRSLIHVYFVPTMMIRCLVRMIVSWLYLYVFLITPASRRLIAACSVLRFSSRFFFSAGFIEPPRYRFKRRRAPAISSSLLSQSRF